jgi:undecaprenyl-diphosphatase
VNALQAALLGIIQGLTEFLPVSSSAHLILARTFFGWEGGDLGLAFDVACHVGTLLAVIVFFRRDVVEMVAAVPGVARGATGDGATLLRALIIGTLPIVVVGLTVADLITASTRTAGVAGVALGLGAVVMFAAERTNRGTRDELSLSWREALGLGVAQAVALVPGVSRSGAVLTVAMLCGLRRDRAARFAFLLGIPAILAAAGREAVELAGQGFPPGTMTLFGVGIATSAMVGYLTVKYFIRYLARYSLDIFAVYRLLLAGSVLLWFVQGRLGM